MAQSKEFLIKKYSELCELGVSVLKLVAPDGFELSNWQDAYESVDH